MQEENIDLRAFFFRLFKYWYVFIITGVVALAGAYLYTRFITSVYQVNATLLIKQEKSSLLDDKAFGGINLKGKEIANEKAIIKSFSMMRETVKQLDFAVSYFIEDRYSQNELYKSTPFIVEYDSLHQPLLGIEFELQFLSENKFKLEYESDNVFLYSSEDKKIGNAENISQSKIFSFGDEIKSENYSFRIIKNPEYNYANFYNEEQYKSNQYSFIFNDLNKQALAYKAATDVELLEKDIDVYKLSLQGNNVNKITDFLNKLLEVYIYENLEGKNKTSQNTIKFIDSQLVEISDSLKFAETRLQDFKSANKVMDVSSQANNLFVELSGLQTEKAKLLSQKKYYNYLLKSIQGNSKYDDLMAPSTIGINDILLNKLVGEMITLSGQAIMISKNTTEKSPAMINIENNIENTKELIIKNVENIINATNISIKEIENRIAALEADARKLPKTQQMLFGFERRFKLNDAIYTFLLQKRAEAQIAQAASVPDAEIIDKARTEQATKKSIKYRTVYMIALLLGLIVPGGVIFLRDLINDRVMSRTDIEKITNIPFVGGIPQFKKPVVNAFNKYPKSPIAESFRSLYSNLQYMLQAKEKNVILITSSMPVEGKTFTAVNLASVFASFNKKTCLLSFDLRLPKIQKTFDSDNDTGVSTYLIKRSRIDEIIVNSDIENLDVIFSGPIPPNPVELIASKQAEELLSFLKSEYDTVILDSPPIGIVTDASMLSKYSDLNLFVIRQNLTKRKVLSDVLNDLRESDKKKTGILFNGEKLKTYGYKYDYFKVEEKKRFRLNLKKLKPRRLLN
jgi:tyrosine-protein kinase Etk/Wzc